MRCVLHDGPRIAGSAGGLAAGLILVGLVLGEQPKQSPARLEATAADLTVNAGGCTYDSKPSLAVTPEGSIWMAWHAYYRGRDGVRARHVGPGEMGPVHVLSEQGTVHDAPVVVATGREAAWIVWAARPRGRWNVLARRFIGDRWLPVESVSPPDVDAICPSAAPVDRGRLIVTWCQHSNRRFQIRARVFEQGAWQEPFAVSPDDHDSFRSTPAVTSGGQVWAFWDACRDGRYSVHGRSLLPDRGPEEQVSPDGENCLTPVALAAQPGLCVAWLRTIDVIGGQGAISQWHTLHMAVRTGDGWRLVRNTNGSTTAAELTHGLMASMDPEPAATGGYLGRRRAAMLLRDGDAVWLLWERKSDHRARTPDATGQLIGRKASGGRWHPPVVLHEGLVDYRLANDAEARAGKFFFAASELPRQWRRPWHCAVGDLNVARPLEQGGHRSAGVVGSGWRPISLPFADDGRPRHEVRIRAKTYRLYWGDLHCHSGLTADAEGEPDELLHYARDRARLDVVVFTENDALYDCYLTEAEFALEHLLARCFTRQNEFLVLPGFEWTSRLPRWPDVDPADPKNFDSQRWSGTYPNHRSVIYPPTGGPVIRHPEVGNDITRLYESVAKAGGITLTQHETWDLTGHPVECGIEVTSGWRLYIRDPTRLHEALDRGHRVGLVACGDSHRRCPGLAGALTGIYAESLAADDVLDALRHRRVFATNGSRIVVQSWANGSFMGEETPAADRVRGARTGSNVEIRLSVVGSRPIVQATLIRDGEEIKTFTGDGSQRLNAVFRDADLPEGTHWYYWRIAQEGESPAYPGNLMVARGHLAWSSPHWVTVAKRTGSERDLPAHGSASRRAGWRADMPLMLPSQPGTFDEIAVKDPSIVFYDGRWHLFYTARGMNQYTTGYVSAARLEDLQDARRHHLKQLRGSVDGYGCAPQVFYFRPQKKWYLVFQTRDANYQPVYSTTTTIDRPQSWSRPAPLVDKDDDAKWIDFWVICDRSTAYLFFTRGHREVCVMTTDIDRFPHGFGAVRRVFAPVHEAVHVYKVQGSRRYHMVYETRVPRAGDRRRYGLAEAPHPLGPWTKVTDEFATGGSLVYPDGVEVWTDEVSHGELVRAGYDERMEYDPKNTTFLIQGLPAAEHRGPYPELPWRLGVIRRKSD